MYERQREVAVDEVVFNASARLAFCEQIEGSRVMPNCV